MERIINELKACQAIKGRKAFQANYTQKQNYGFNETILQVNEIVSVQEINAIYRNYCSYRYFLSTP